MHTYILPRYYIKVQFSLLSRYPLTSGLVEKCQELNIQLIGYSPLALGLLTDKYSFEKNMYVVYFKYYYYVRVLYTKAILYLI